jgi:hypothetical protein
MEKLKDEAVEEKKKQDMELKTETIYLKKPNGLLIKRKVNHAANQAQERAVQDILKKDNCLDIFRDAFIGFDQNSKNDPDRLNNFTKYKFKKKS